ncbi:MAG: hypothetical protein ACR2PL_05320 [Dehalococcoidia bacterium]
MLASRRLHLTLGFVVVLGSALFALATTAVGFRAPAQAAVTAEPAHCSRAFQIDVRQGPDAGLSLVGTLTLDADASGNATGVFEVFYPDDRAASVPVVGQVNGRALNLLFLQPDGGTLYGVGVMQNLLQDCSGSLGGPSIGPSDGDFGDWTNCDVGAVYITCVGGGVTVQCRAAGNRQVCMRIR